MAKKVLKINKGGAAAAPRPSELGIKGPRAPVRLGAEPAAEPSARNSSGSSQPVKKIVVAASAQQLRPKSGSSAAGPRGQQQRQPPKKTASSGPPPWLIPLVIMGLIVLIVIVVSVSSNSKQDPYFSSTPQYQEKQRYIPQEGPRPMKEWMDEHGESEMAKERKARMKNRPVTTAGSTKSE